ncbi:serine/threonine-protein kinase [Allosalinactinospora lopnorensis]|uniref:serine/threonine-protein kinase n=1 Tax=Allosalinactinospora lopnorensis TaxID=1352348 RepID=UPI00069687EB|nr:serine/threonine-protein kinase [Allosalinactinospora lopnorensis]
MTSGSDTRVVADRYHLRRRLGRGGMGVVWQAWDPELEREVAIKEVLVPEGLSPEEREEAHARTRREARSAARLSHRSIITIHDVFDFGDHPWIVMELITGRALDTALKENGPLPPEQVASMASSLLDALLLAHSKGVVHRDIKPGNVMLADDKRVILTDFGIATIDGETAITRTGALIGSPEYMAPERLQQESSETPSDIWSLGATLFAAVEGQSPFKRETVTASISAVLSAPIPQPQRAGPLAPLLMGMLDRDVTRRLGASQAAQLLTAATPAAPHQPTGANPAMATPAGGMLPPTQQYPPSPPMGPPGHQPGPGGFPEPAKTGNKRKVYTVLAAAGALVLLIAIGAVWAAKRPLDTEYRLHAADHFSFEYPEDWTVEEDDDRITVTHPDTREEIFFVIDSYSPDEDHPVDEIEEKSDGDWETADLDGYERLSLETVDGDYLPESWSAATWEYRHTDEDQDHPDRHRLRHQIHREGAIGREAVWLSWDLPEGQYSRHKRIIEHVNRSLRSHDSF